MIKKLLIFFACKALLTFAYSGDEVIHSHKPQNVTCLRMLLHLSVGCPGSALSTTPDLWNRVLNKQLIGWVSCLAWWERRLFLSVYRLLPLSLSQSCTLCIVYERTMSYATTAHQTSGFMDYTVVTCLCSFPVCLEIFCCLWEGLSLLILQPLFICESQLSSPGVQSIAS